jgi:hypothetical protein
MLPARMLVILAFATDKRSGPAVIGQRQFEANTTATEGGSLERRHSYNPRVFYHYTMPVFVQVAYLEDVTTEVLTALTISITLLSAVTPCSLAVKHLSLRRTSCSIIATEEYRTDGGSTLFLNVGIYLPNYTASHSIRTL